MMKEAFMECWIKIDILVVCFFGKGVLFLYISFPWRSYGRLQEDSVNFCKLVDNNGKRKCTFSLSFMFLRAYLWIFSCCMDVLC